jgi:hypothetical protein
LIRVRGDFSAALLALEMLLCHSRSVSREQTCSRFFIDRLLRGCVARIRRPASRAKLVKRLDGSAAGLARLAAGGGDCWINGPI